MENKYQIMGALFHIDCAYARDKFLPYTLIEMIMNKKDCAAKAMWYRLYIEVLDKVSKDENKIEYGLTSEWYWETVKRIESVVEQLESIEWS